MIEIFVSGIELMGKGGAMMYPIFLASVIAVAIIIERFVFLRNVMKTRTISLGQ